MISTHTNILPDLPRTLKKREASITPRILDWFQNNYHLSCALEIKVTKTGSIAKSALLPHQLQSLLQAQTKDGIVHKISDIGRIRQPFDSFVLKNAQSFVICAFLNHKVCLAINPNKWNGATPTTQATFAIPLWSKV